MDIKARKVLVLGGAGQVGFAICRQLMREGPSKIIVSSLYQRESEEAVKGLHEEFPDAGGGILRGTLGQCICT